MRTTFDMAAIDQNAPDFSVDEAPISTKERRESLSKHLANRADKQDLVDKHILLDTNAAPYVEAP